MAPSARFWDRIARRYARKPIGDLAAYETKLEITRGYLTPESRVLEPGCGTGTTAIALAPLVGQLHAVDISAGMLAIAEAKAEAAKAENLSFQKAAVEDLTLPEGTLDVVLAHSLLHLLEDREAALARFYTWLKPGGVLVSSTACLGDGMAWFRAVAPLGRALGLIPLVRIFTVKELESSLLGAGFEIERQWQPGRNKAVFLVARKPHAASREAGTADAVSYA